MTASTGRCCGKCCAALALMEISWVLTIALYTDCNVTMNTGGCTGQHVPLRTGVRQHSGCPLSPTLLGLFADGLHRHLLQWCPSDSGVQVPDLGHADDFAVPGHNPSRAAAPHRCSGTCRCRILLASWNGHCGGLCWHARAIAGAALWSGLRHSSALVSFSVRRMVCSTPPQEDVGSLVFATTSDWHSAVMQHLCWAPAAHT